MSIAVKVAAWIHVLKDIHGVRPCVVTIGDEQWEGCEYTQTLTPPFGARNSEPYDRTAIYLVGNTPKDYGKTSKVCFLRDNGDHRDWYVAGYIRDTRGYAEHHPFGPNFLLMPWDIPGNGDSRIDNYELKPYKRLKMRVEHAK